MTSCLPIVYNVLGHFKATEKGDTRSTGKKPCWQTYSEKGKDSHGAVKNSFIDMAFDNGSCSISRTCIVFRRCMDKRYSSGIDQMNKDRDVNGRLREL